MHVTSQLQQSPLMGVSCIGCCHDLTFACRQQQNIAHKPYNKHQVLACKCLLGCDKLVSKTKNAALQVHLSCNAGHLSCSAGLTTRQVGLRWSTLWLAHEPVTALQAHKGAVLFFFWVPMARWFLAKQQSNFAYGTALRRVQALLMSRDTDVQSHATHQVSLHVKHGSPSNMTANFFCSAICKLCGRCRGYFRCMRVVNKNDLRACPTAFVEDGIANQICLVSCSTSQLA